MVKGSGNPRVGLGWDLWHGLVREWKWWKLPGWLSSGAYGNAMREGGRDL